MPTSKRRNKALNLLMVVLAAVIVVAGVLFVLDMRGVLPASDAAVFAAADKTGNVNIERDGVSYQLNEGDSLRADDAVQTLSGSSIAVTADDKGSTALDEQTKGTVQSGGLSLDTGTLFCTVGDGQALSLTTAQTSFTAGTATFVVSAQTGVTQLYVLDGTVTLGDDTVTRGSWATVSDGTGSTTVEKGFNAAAFDDFMLERIAAADKQGAHLCLSQSAVKKEQAKREKAQKAATGASGSVETDAAKKAESSSASASSSSTGESAADSASTSDGNGAASTATDDAVDQENEEAASNADESGASGNAANDSNASTKSKAKKTAKAKASQAKASQVTVEIRCDTILKHKKRLAAGKSKYVPSNGVILKRTKVTIADGDTAFDVLKAVCQAEDIQLEYRYTPVYETNYVQGINNLYEKDCGDQSGWIYKVNGWEPNVGASQYAVKNGDAIVWAYTCEGYGQDVA